MVVRDRANREDNPADLYQVRCGGLREKIFRLILEEERRSVWANLLRVVATLAAWLYDKVVTLRNLLFDHGVLRIHRLNCPVISVGNLAMELVWIDPEADHATRGAR